MASLGHIGITRATKDEIDDALRIIRECSADLQSRGIVQWDEEYPNRAYLQAAADGGHLYVLRTDAGEICGTVVLDEKQAPEWKTIAWGAGTEPCLVLHALAISPAAQGRGIGGSLLRACETMARSRGYASVRLDAFAGNAAALRLYERNGYQFRGEITLAFKPAGHRKYLCFEKGLET